MNPNANQYENTIGLFFNSTLILKLKIFMDDKSWNYTHDPSKSPNIKMIPIILVNSKHE